MGLLVRIQPRIVLVVAALYLIVAWSSVALIDVFDVAGLRSTLGRDDGAPVWVHLFGEARTTEWMQWLALGLTALVAAIRAGEARQRDNILASRFLTLLAVTAILMLVEDAGNPSHVLATYGEDLFGQSFIVGLSFRLPVFVVIGAVPLYALLRYWWPIARGLNGGGMLLGGVGVYGIAAFSSVPANLLFDFYPRFGPWLTEELMGGRLLLLDDETLQGDPAILTGWLFMDFVYEESLELIGASLLLAGLVALGHSLTEIPIDEVDATERGPAL